MQIDVLKVHLHDTNKFRSEEGRLIEMLTLKIDVSNKHLYERSKKNI